MCFLQRCCAKLFLCFLLWYPGVLLAIKTLQIKTRCKVLIIELWKCWFRHMFYIQCQATCFPPMSSLFSGWLCYHLLIQGQQIRVHPVVFKPMTTLSNPVSPTVSFFFATAALKMSTCNTTFVFFNINLRFYNVFTLNTKNLRAGPVCVTMSVLFLVQKHQRQGAHMCSS